jgi:hypothetical protein
MTERKVGRLLERFSRALPVNKELKAHLRAEMAQAGGASLPAEQNRRRFWPVLTGVTAVVLAAAIGLTSFGLPGQAPGQNVALAASLQVVDQRSFVNLASGQQGAPAVAGDKLYVPVFGKGIFLLDAVAVQSGAGMTQVLAEPNVVSVAASHQGDRLAYVTSKGVYLYDLDSGSVSSLIEGNDYDVYYEEPTFMPGDQSVLVTRKTVQWLERGFEVKAREICEVKLAGGDPVKVADGSHASVSFDGSFLVYERDGQIIVRGLDAGGKKRDPEIPGPGEEKVLGDGRYPSLSPDGGYVAFIGQTENRRDLTERARVVETLSNVVIASVRNFTDQRQVTGNYPFRFIDENEWLQQVGPQGGELQLTGTYDYYEPVWGADGQSLFVLKEDRGGGLRLMRTLVGREGLSPVAVVEKWLEAVVNRDDDFARSLMVNPPELLTMSNPHPVGFTEPKSGSDSNGEYVEAVLYEAYTAQPYFTATAKRFYLESSAHGYVIAETRDVDKWEVVAQGDGVIKVTRNGGEPEITYATGAGSDALGAVAYDEATGTLFFNIKTDDNNWAVKALDKNSGEPRYAVGVSHRALELVPWSVTQEGKTRPGYLVVNVGPHVMLVDLESGMPFQTLGKSDGGFRGGNHLVLYTEYDGGRVRWEFDPATGKTSLW